MLSHRDRDRRQFALGYAFPDRGNGFGEMRREMSRVALRLSWDWKCKKGQQSAREKAESGCHISEYVKCGGGVPEKTWPGKTWSPGLTGGSAYCFRSYSQRVPRPSSAWAGFFVGT